MPRRMHKDEVEISEELVRRMLASQMPELAGRSLGVVKPWGTDNAIWRVGDDLVIRLPRIHWAASQVEQEAFWLPRLAPHLPIPVPEPRAIGEPAFGYPYRWAVHKWLPGQSATLARIDDPIAFALDLARFVRRLQEIPTNGAPGASNRARPLAVFDEETRRAIDRASHLIDAAAALEVWEEALAAPARDGAPVWVQGDLEGNCIVRDGRLSGVVD